METKGSVTHDMMPGEADDMTALAWAALGGEDRSARERAWAILAAEDGFVARQAMLAWRRACARYGWRFAPNHRVVLEFLQEAPGRIHDCRANFVQHYRLAQAAGRLRGFFAAWCGPVLVSGFCQHVRTMMARAERDAASRPPPYQPSDSARNLRQALASDDPLSPPDLAAIAAWELDYRIFLPADAGFFHKIPQYAHWVAQRGLKQPFPPQSVRLAPSHAQRTLLAAAMGVSRAVADQWWHRGKRLLKDLELFNGEI